MQTLLGKILIFVSSLGSIGFGIWHFFVPKAWNWYSYINPQATELILAVRAINVFFSLSLVLFGVMNIGLVLGPQSGTSAHKLVVVCTCILWFTRVGMQLALPQGTMNPALQFGMLAGFVVIFLGYLVPLVLGPGGR